jgi:hypothetical protein
VRKVRQEREQKSRQVATLTVRLNEKIEECTDQANTISILITKLTQRDKDCDDLKRHLRAVNEQTQFALSYSTD